MAHLYRSEAEEAADALDALAYCAMTPEEQAGERWRRKRADQARAAAAEQAAEDYRQRLAAALLRITLKGGTGTNCGMDHALLAGATSCGTTAAAYSRGASGAVTSELSNA